MPSLRSGGVSGRPRRRVKFRAAVAVIPLILMSCTASTPTTSSSPSTSPPGPGSTGPVPAPPETPRPRPSLDASPLYWFAPLGLQPGEPYDGAPDFMSLFQPGADWETAAGHIQVFKLYGGWVARPPSIADVERAVAGIQERGLALAVEVGPLDPPGDCGVYVEGFAGTEEGPLIASRIKDLGGTIDLLALDEPYYYAHFYDGESACHWSARKVAAEIGEYIDVMRSYFPDVIVGDIEPLVGPAGAKAYRDWLDTFRRVNGYDLGFLHLDIDWSRPGWVQEVKSIRRHGRNLGVPIGLIYNGNAFDPTDEAWLSAAGERVKRYELEGNGRIDHVIFQSWNDRPDHVLPEGAAFTFTGFVKSYFEDKSSLGYRGGAVNLARGRPVSTSRTLDGLKGSQVTDGDLGTLWNSGTEPEHWIEVDLGAAHDIGEIRLTVAQYPAGPTRHLVLGARSRGAGFTVLHTFRGDTADGETLGHTPDAPWRGIRIIRILTPTARRGYVEGDRGLRGGLTAGPAHERASASPSRRLEVPSARAPISGPPLMRALLAPIAAISAAERALTVVASALTAGWLLFAAAVRMVRQPRNPDPAPPTLDLGPERPAVANLLTKNFRVRPEALPATLLDLAARRMGVQLEQTHPGVYGCRLRPPSPRSAEEPMSPYEERVLAYLHRKAVNGVVPAGALTTGPREESRRWFRAFARDVVAEAQGLGLSQDLWDRRMLRALYVAATIPALLFGMAFGWGPLAMALSGVALVGAIDVRRRQRDTPAGLEAAGRWLGVRAKLAEDEVFPDLPPTAVAMWERYLAYGAALGVAGRAVAALPMGAESDTRAWSAYQGRWREVKVRYPRFFPPGWGMPPWLAAAAGLGALLAGAFVLSVVLQIGLLSTPEAFPPTLKAILVAVKVAATIAAGVALLWGSLALVLGLADLRSPAEVSGRVIRLRSRGSKEKRRFYAAVDDGRSKSVLAWRLPAELYGGLRQGQNVRAVTTKQLGHVHSIQAIDAGPPGEAVGGPEMDTGPEEGLFGPPWSS